MKEKYSKLFEGLTDDEKAAKKEDLIKALQEARGLDDVDRAENGRRSAVMKREGDLIKKKVRKLVCRCYVAKQRLNVQPLGTISTQLLEHRHGVLSNQRGLY
jgi:hypothetical protein